MKHFCVEICFQGNSVPETSVAALLCLRGGLKPHKVCIAVWPVCNCEYVRGRLTVRGCVCVCALSERERGRRGTSLVGMCGGNAAYTHSMVHCHMCVVS